MDSYLWIAIAAGTSLGVLLIWIWRDREQRDDSRSHLEDAAPVDEVS